MTRIMSCEHSSGKDGSGTGTSYGKCCRIYCGMESVQGCGERAACTPVLPLFFYSLLYHILL